jgi:predicted Zn-ribbon and HTH transcriptional regulator
VTEVSLATASIEAVSGELRSAIAHLPTRAHRALFRLLVDAIVARHHLRHIEPSGWPSFVAVGPTKTGKSLLGLGACKLFGLDAARTIRSVPAETERSFWGRRYQTGGGAWEFRPSPVLAYPLLVLDELDKAPESTRRASLKLLQGETRVPAEDEVLVEVAPTALVLSNGAAAMLPPEYRRRSVVLDTTRLVDELAELGPCARRFLDSLPVLDLGSLRVPRGSLTDAVVDYLAQALRAGLSDTGWRMADERSLGLLVGARFAVFGLDPVTAVRAVVSDYLDVAETVDETPRAPGPIEPAPYAKARRLAASEKAQRERDERGRERAQAMRLAVSRAEVLDVLHQATPDPDDHLGAARSEAVSLAARIAEAVRWLEDAETMGDLDELADDLVELIDEAHAWRDTHPMYDHDEVIDAEGWDDDECDTGPYVCRNCGNPFDEPEVDENGRTWRCPSCGVPKPLSRAHSESRRIIETTAGLRVLTGPVPTARPWRCNVCGQRYAEEDVESPSEQPRSLTRGCPTLSCRSLAVLWEPEHPPAPTGSQAIGPALRRPCSVCRTLFPPCGMPFCPEASNPRPLPIVPGRPVEPA